MRRVTPTCACLQAALTYLGWLMDTWQDGSGEDSKLLEGAWFVLATTARGHGSGAVRSADGRWRDFVQGTEDLMAAAEVLAKLSPQQLRNIRQALQNVRDEVASSKGGSSGSGSALRAAQRAKPPSVAAPSANAVAAAEKAMQELLLVQGSTLLGYRRMSSWYCCQHA